MVEEPAMDELMYRTFEWTLGVVTEWVEVNEAARARQAAAPPEEQERVQELPSGFGPLASAMAITLNPEALIVAHAVLTSAQAQLRSILASRSMSHPSVMLTSQGPSDEKTGQAVQHDDGDDLGARVRRLEAQMQEAVSLLRQHLVSCPGVHEGSTGSRSSDLRAG